MDKIFKYQQYHLVSLLTLFCLFHLFTKANLAVLSGNLWGIDTVYWYVLAFVIPVLHQVYVLVIWRGELYFKSISNFFGEKGFSYFKIGFSILFVSRLLSIILLAFSNKYTLDINTTLSYILAALLFMPSVYLFYSVLKYFGMDRAFGADHFYPVAASKMPFVRQGIFKYSSNGMYIYGFMILWIPGLLLQSQAALLAALFNHVYIWVHYYFTELPDIRIIYGDK